MRRAARQRSILLLIVAVLLVAAVWQSRRDEQDETGTLTALDPSTISRITLALSGASTLHYEKRDGHWWRVDGAPVRAVDGRLAELADTAAAHVLSWRPASDFKLAKIGLSNPQAVLTLDGQSLAFGESSVTGPQHYVLVGQRVALISDRYMPHSPAAAVVNLH
ncbi:hypothetical protein [Rhodanobacter sp. L36]|uniref:hypothetical protein n=1 Tax=Rhodanobacter sp. L36 TaxID=1747221 RepID=UPI00131CA26F|nr:hypothetical protein [Rhodanobacter sp. L36]